MPTLLEPPVVRWLLKPREVAEQFGVTTATLQAWVDAGTFPEPLRLSPRSYFWDSAKLQAWIEAA